MHRVLPPLVVLATFAAAAAPALALSVAIDPVPGVSTSVPTFVPVTISGAPNARVELKAWIGAADGPASRTWTGERWQRSDWYAVDVELDASGAWSGWLAVRFNAGSVNAPAVLATDTSVVGVRARGAGERAEATVEAPRIVSDHGVPVAAPSPGLLEVRANGTAVFVAPTPSPLNDTWVELPAVAEATIHVDGTPLAEGTGRFVAAAPAPEPFVVVEGDGGVLTWDDGWTRVAAGSQRHDLPDGAGAVRLWSGLQLLDCVAPAPGPDGCTAVDDAPGGWTVRDPLGGRWLPWPLPRGHQAWPIETIHVDGRIAAAATGPDRWSLAAATIDAAHEDIRMTAYTFTSGDLAARLAGASMRGVDVDLLVERQPIGGRSVEEDRVLAALAAAGVNVRWAADGPFPTGVLHAKTIVVDGRVTLVSTENWGDGGHPRAGTGNVGWSVAIEDATLAAAVGRALDTWWTMGLDADPDAPPLWLEPPDDGSAVGWAPLRARVTPLISPHNAWRDGGMPAAIGTATERVDLLLLRADPDDDPWTRAAVDAARRGVAVRALVNGVPLGAGHDPWLDDGGAALQRALDGSRSQARASDAGGPPVHAKGAVVDGRLVLVGSMNWVPAGQRMNREIGLLIEDTRTAGVFGASFEANWAEPPQAVATAIPGPTTPLASAMVALAAVLGRSGGGFLYVRFWAGRTGDHQGRFKCPCAQRRWLSRGHARSPGPRNRRGTIMNDHDGGTNAANGNGHGNGGGGNGHAIPLVQTAPATTPRPMRPGRATAHDVVARTSTGITRLDQLLGGGLRTGSTTLGFGPPFSGKRTLTTQFALEGLRTGSPAVLVLTDRAAVDVRQALAELDHTYTDYEDAGSVHFVDAYSRIVGADDGAPNTTYLDSALDLNGVMAAVNSAWRRMLPDHDDHRLVVDSVSTLLAYSTPQAVFRFLQVFKGRAQRAGATTMLSLCSGMHDVQCVEMLKHLCDGVLEMSQEEDKRLMRAIGNGLSASKNRFVEYDVTDQGIEIVGSFSAGRIR